MKTTTTKYLFELPKKNTEKMRMKILSLKSLINEMGGVHFEESVHSNNFEIKVYNYPFAIRHFATVLEMMEYIFEKDNIEISGGIIEE